MPLDRPPEHFPKQLSGTAEDIMRRTASGHLTRQEMNAVATELERMTREIAAWREAFPMFAVHPTHGHVARVDWSVGGDTFG